VLVPAVTYTPPPYGAARFARSVQFQMCTVGSASVVDAAESLAASEITSERARERRHDLRAPLAELRPLSRPSTRTRYEILKFVPCSYRIDGGRVHRVIQFCRFEKRSTSARRARSRRVSGLVVTLWRPPALDPYSSRSLSRCAVSCECAADLFECRRFLTSRRERAHSTRTNRAAIAAFLQAYDGGPMVGSPWFQSQCQPRKRRR